MDRCKDAAAQNKGVLWSKGRIEAFFTTKVGAEAGGDPHAGCQSYVW
jgi:hypothetical protein